jgi:hypothetical protein
MTRTRTLLTLAAVLVACTVAEDISGGWVLGPAGKLSCNIICQASQLKCNVASMQQLASKFEFENIKNRLNITATCKKYAYNAPKYSPAIRQADGVCQINATYTACEKPQYYVPPATMQRICCCRETGCNFTNPVRDHTLCFACVSFDSYCSPVTYPDCYHELLFEAESRLVVVVIIT